MVNGTSPPTDNEAGNCCDPAASRADQDVEARSAANIRSWREYLPDECIATMINMGWHEST